MQERDREIRRERPREREELKGGKIINDMQERIKRKRKRERKMLVYAYMKKVWVCQPTKKFRHQERLLCNEKRQR